MANTIQDDLFRTKRGIAALVTCLAQTLNESDPSFQKRFVTRLDKAYRHLRDNPQQFGDRRAANETSAPTP
jgi:hypothetical protein